MKANRLLILGCAVALGSMVHAQSHGNATGLGVSATGSPHNFYDGIDNPSHRDPTTAADETFTGEICNVCHVPHGGLHAYTEGLLWNHELSSQVFTMYPQDSLDGTVAAQPTNSTRLCMGCHDDTVAVDAFGHGPPRTNFASNWGIYTSGQNLGGTHPVSLIYDNIADTELRDPATTPMGTSGMIEDVLEGALSNSMECNSCHDVHDTDTVAGTSLLRVDTGGSELCLVCHDK